MKPVIKYLEPKKIVGLVYEGDNGKQEIGSIWQELMIRLDEIQHKVGDMNAYGLCAPLFDHIEDFDLMQQNTFMYLAGVEVTDFEALPEGMTSWHVTHEKYAVFKHVGPLDQISETFKAIYMKWLPESGHEVVKGYDFELYDEHFNPMDENPVTYLYIPIQ